MDRNSSTLILLDPSSPDGEAGLRIAQPGDAAAITLMVLLEDPSSAPLAEFAKAENISMSAAANRYLDQVVGRTEVGVRVDAVFTAGDDAVGEILAVADERGAGSVIVPPSLPGLRGRSWQRLVAGATVPIVVAPRIAA
jgi:hypothetical protein